MNAQELKNEGINRTLDNNAAWKEGALYVVKNLPADWRGTGEDIRALVDEEPSHPNAWGGLVSKAVSEGFIKPTGEYTAMVSKKSHGRKTAVYVRAA